MSEVALRLAEALADEVRPLGIIPVDSEAVASCLGIRVETRSMAESVLGATASEARIVINDSLDEPVRRFVLAHEIAHVLVKRGHATFANSRVEELFADAFAAALLVPAAALADDVADIDDSARRLMVRSSVVASRVAVLRRRMRPRAA